MQNGNSKWITSETTRTRNDFEIKVNKSKLIDQNNRNPICFFFPAGCRFTCCDRLWRQEPCACFPGKPTARSPGCPPHMPTSSVPSAIPPGLGGFSLSEGARVQSQAWYLHTHVSSMCVCGVEGGGAGERGII